MYINIFKRKSFNTHQNLFLSKLNFIQQSIPIISIDNEFIYLPI